MSTYQLFNHCYSTIRLSLTLLITAIALSTSHFFNHRYCYCTIHLSTFRYCPVPFCCYVFPCILLFQTRNTKVPIVAPEENDGLVRRVWG